MGAPAKTIERNAMDAAFRGWSNGQSCSGMANYQYKDRSNSGSDSLRPSLLTFCQDSNAEEDLQLTGGTSGRHLNAKVDSPRLLIPFSVR